MAEAYQYYRGYKDLEVPVPGELFGDFGPRTFYVHISQYQNTGSTNPKHGTPGNIDDNATDDFMKIWKLYAATPYDTKRPWQHFVKLPDGIDGDFFQTFYNVHHGKGGVQEIRFVLQLLAWQRGVVDGNLKHSQDLASLIQGHSKKIGVDCNGFVMNCVKAVKHASFSEYQIANTGTLAFTGPAFMRYKTEHVLPMDIVSYLQERNDKDPDLTQDVSHVAVIDRVSGKLPDLEVTLVESAGGFGPRSSTETVVLSEMGKKGAHGPVFWLTRKPPPGGSLPRPKVAVYVSYPMPLLGPVKPPKK